MPSPKSMSKGTETNARRASASLPGANVTSSSFRITSIAVSRIPATFHTFAIVACAAASSVMEWSAGKTCNGRPVGVRRFSSATSEGAVLCVERT